MKNSFKHIYRSPVRAALFFVLIAISTAVLVFASALWLQTKAQIDSVKSQFTTIGTVEQRPNTVEIMSQWDAAIQGYINSANPQYDALVEMDALRSVEAEYLSGPEKRPYYGAQLNGLRTTRELSWSQYHLVVEFTPDADCVPDQPVRVQIQRVLLGNALGSDSFWFCDHYTENPAALEKGKTYIAALQMYPPHTEDGGLSVEFVPYSHPYTTQYDQEGNRILSDALSDVPLWEEVSEDFYTNGRGRYWENLVEAIERLDSTIPVLPTESMALLPSDHENKVQLVDGREIHSEEFELGSPVCMITDGFAKANDLQVGDTLDVSLYFANYNTPASLMFGYNSGALNFSLLNAAGEPYPVFHEKEYEIVGTYRYLEDMSGTNVLGGTEMARDMVIIPTGAVTDSDENNICDWGPMQDATASFQIPNGTIEAFEEVFQTLPESRVLQITYDDNGYGQVIGSLNRVSGAAALMFGVGFLTIVGVLILLLYFYVIKQKKRTAIEHSLGMSKAQCRVSVLAGLVVLTVTASVVGSLLGGGFLHVVQPENEIERTAFSTKFSEWSVAEEAAGIEPDEAAEPGEPLGLMLGIPLALAGFTILAGLALTERNLRIEPLQLLGARNE